jgi:hypothetical protein
MKRLLLVALIGCNSPAPSSQSPLCIAMASKCAGSAGCEEIEADLRSESVAVASTVTSCAANAPDCAGVLHCLADSAKPETEAFLSGECVRIIKLCDAREVRRVTRRCTKLAVSLRYVPAERLELDKCVYAATTCDEFDQCLDAK